jgi:hypothetical protein
MPAVSLEHTIGSRRTTVPLQSRLGPRNPETELQKVAGRAFALERVAPGVEGLHHVTDD